MKKITKHIKTYSRGLNKMRRKIIIDIKSNYLKLIHETWKIMKEKNSKKKCNNETLPKHLIVDNIEINDAKFIAEKVNEFLSKFDRIFLTKFLDVT